MRYYDNTFRVGTLAKNATNCCQRSRDEQSYLKIPGEMHNQECLVCTIKAVYSIY